MEKKHYDVGILGLWAGNNYGCILTGYALYKIIESMGYSVAFIDRINKKINYNTMIRKFVAKLNVYKIPSTHTCFLNTVFDTFLVGSDQVWNWHLTLCWNKFLLLDFACKHKKKIAFASSIGNDFDTNGSSAELEICKAYMSKFDNISIREDYAVRILKDKLGISSIQVLDPVFVCNNDVYYDLAAVSQVTLDEDYIFAYILDPNEEKNKILQNIASKLGKKIYISTDATNNSQKRKLFFSENNVLDEIPLEDWLKYYNNASYIITDSFHGTCFAIIFNKQFISLGNSKRGNKRFEAMLSSFGLLDRLTDNIDRMEQLLQLNINYSRVNDIILEKRQFAYNWLNQALCKEKNINFVDSLLQQLIPLKMNTYLFFTSVFYHFKLLFYILLRNNNKILKYKKNLNQLNKEF